MINIIKTKLENKTDKSFIYYLNSSKIILEPYKSITVSGDIFSKESRQEGSTENLLVNVHNGNIALTLIVDDKFVTDVVRESVVVLPSRAQAKLADTVVTVKEEPKKVEAPVVQEVKAEPVVEPKKVETKKVEEAPKKAEVKKEVKKETKKVEEVSLESVELKDSADKVTKL